MPSTCPGADSMDEHHLIRAIMHKQLCNGHMPSHQHGRKLAALPDILSDWGVGWGGSQETFHVCFSQDTSTGVNHASQRGDLRKLDQ